MKLWQNALLSFGIGVAVTILGNQVVQETKQETHTCIAPVLKPTVCDCTGSKLLKVLPSEQFFAPGEIE